MDEAKWLKKKEKALRESNKELLFESCKKLAEIYKEDGKYELSLSYFKKAQDLCEKTVDVAVMNRWIGEVYCDMEMFHDAIKYQKKHLELSTQEGNKVEIQRALATLGRTYFIQGLSYTTNKERTSSLQNSYDYYLKSEETCDLLGGISSFDLAVMKARLYLNIGLTLEALGTTDESISYLSKAITISKSNDLKSELVQCYTRLAEVYLKQQKHSEALATIQKCIRFINTQSELNTYCELLLLKCDVHVDMFDFVSAKVDSVRAYKLKHLNSMNRKDAEKHLRLIIVLINNENKLMELNIDDNQEKNQVEQAQLKKNIYEHMGDACAALGNYSKAVHFYHKMLEACETIIKITYSTELGIGLTDSLESCVTDLSSVLSSELCKDLASCYISLAQTYKDYKQYPLALDYFNRELTLHKRNFSEACKTLGEICNLYELQEKPFKLIYETYEKALDLAQRNGDVRLQRVILSSMKKLCKKQDQPTELASVKSSLTTIECQLSSLSSSEDEDDAVEDSPNIGDDINLEQLSDLNSSNEENEEDKQRTNRKRVQRSHFLIKRNDKGETALHVAAARGNLTLVKSLLKQGHPVKVQDSAGWLPLHEAANHGHRDIVAALVDAGADPNDKGGTGISPLHDAAANGYLEVIEILLDKGASTAQRTNQGETAKTLLEECKARVERAQGELDPSVGAHFEQIVRKLQVPDELTTGQKASGRAQTDFNRSQMTQGRRPSRDVKSQPSVRNREKRSDYNSTGSHTGQSLRNRRELSPDSDVSDSSTPGNVSDLREERSSSPARNIDSSSDEESATREYQKAMSNLRSAREGLSKVRTIGGTRPAAPVKTRQFLEETEVGDDWLEQDVIEGVGGKKRKYYKEDNGRRTEEGESKRVRCEGSKHYGGETPSKETPSSSDNRKYGRNKDIVNISSTLGRRKSDSPRKDLVASMSKAPSFESLLPKRPSFSPPPQRKLPTTGQSRSIFEPSQNLFPEDFEPPDFETALARVESNENLNGGVLSRIGTNIMGSHVSSSNIVRNMTGSSTNIANTCDRLIGVTDVSNTRMSSIKIKIESHTFLIPVVRDDSVLSGEKKISWLKQEASTRYYRLEGVTPILRIKTQDGALVDDNDPLASVLDESLILTEVISWNKPPVIQRYQQLCEESGVRCHKHFESALTSDSARFVICSCVKAAPVLVSLFRTFLHWTDLVEIVLSRAFLQDDNMKVLSENMTNLIKLQKLSLSCNHITHLGVKYLSEKCATLVQLQELDVSFNPLSNAVLPHLNNMVAVCPKLSRINLSFTNLTKLDTDLNLFNMENIDVSRNKLGASEVTKLLSLLNADLVVSLNVSATLETSGSLRLKTNVIENRHSSAFKSNEQENSRPSVSPCKSPNLDFNSRNNSTNQDTLSVLNLPDILSMMPRNPTPDEGNAQTDIQLNNECSEITKVFENKDKTIWNDDMENCQNIENMDKTSPDKQSITNNDTDLDTENQRELDRLLNCSPIMDRDTSEGTKREFNPGHASEGTTFENSNFPGSTSEGACNSLGITREVVLFLEQSEHLNLQRLSLSDIDMTNEEATMLYNVLNSHAKQLTRLNISCNPRLSQSSIELFKSVVRESN
uniref:Tonsoku-like protein n=1 Tax=Cacopsylla melanoneura TaxID=428564 RepID=A0A8D8SW85_9HEMI